MGEIQVHEDWAATPSKRYYADVHHSGLNEYKRITGADPNAVLLTAQSQLAKWDEKWRVLLARQEAADLTEREKQGKQARKEAADKHREGMARQAAELSSAAQEVVSQMNNLLRHTVSRNDRIDWNTLLDRSPFAKPRPSIPRPSISKPVIAAPAKPQPPTIPPVPLTSHAKYQVSLTLAERVVPGWRRQKEEQANRLYQADYGAWLQGKNVIENRFAEERRRYLQAEQQQVMTAERNWQAAVTRAESDWAEALRKANEQWERERAAFETEIARRNASVKQLHAQYMAGDQQAVGKYCKLVLDRSQYPLSLSRRQYSLTYNPDTRILVMEYSLPLPEDMPQVKEVKYVQSRDALEEVVLPPARVNELYDSVLYQIAVRTIHEMYEADAACALDCVVFNGWVTFVDKGTGHEVTACILTVQANKDAFLAVNLAQVDGKSCFKQLKGVGSAQLHGLAPVAPLLQLNKEDKRFVSSYEVAATLNTGVNLASMPWEDFEHLIRELFEREFAQNGGEVKVTQASRDGGVDAVAFDPDPIRGGKIVIQAKRYTNTVGVSAVRDLYGTVLNEGATKGILVTTSDYGPDSYEFAKGKPLTLLTGGNLLHLLEKHGHKARIDIQEAKQMAAQ